MYVLCMWVYTLYAVKLSMLEWHVLSAWSHSQEIANQKDGLMAAQLKEVLHDHELLMQCGAFLQGT